MHKKDYIDGKQESLGVFELAPGRDMDSRTRQPYGAYKQQLEKFCQKAAEQYGCEIITKELS